jgi:hypothetical protein
MKKVFLLIFMLSVTIANNADASIIFFTGEVPYYESQEPGQPRGGWGLRYTQWLSTEFIIDQNTNLTSVYGYMSSAEKISADPAGLLTLTIYGDGGETPDVNNQIYSNKFSVPYYNLQVGYDGWYGISNLNEPLTPGFYWVAFEVRFLTDGDSYFGTMPEFSPSPLLNTAVWHSGSGLYTAADYVGFGLKIEGDINAVPIPGGIWLFGSGLVGIIGLKRFKRNRHA